MSRTRRFTPFVVDRKTVRLLLLPQPLLSTIYLLAVHTGLLEASRVTPLLLAVFPITTAMLAISGLRTDGCSRRRNWAVLEISVVELISALLLFFALQSDGAPNSNRRLERFDADRTSGLSRRVTGVGQSDRTQSLVE